jgi:hypothetical protein
MTIDDKDEREAGTAAPGDTATLTPPETGQGAIRGAFLARAAQNAVAGEGGGQGERADATLRGAYITQIARELRRREVVVGTEDRGGSVLRSVYAAQSIVTTLTSAAPARRPRAAAKKAAPAKRKTAPAKKKAAPAKKRRAKAAAPKARAQKRRPVATAARRKAAKKAAAPARRKKSGRGRARR